MGKLLKITESQLKMIVESLHDQSNEINEQRSAGVNTGNTVTQNSNTVTQTGKLINWTVKPGSQQLEQLIQGTGLECLRDATFGRSINGKFEFYVSSINKPELKFYVSDDNQSYVTISNDGGKAHTVVRLANMDTMVGYSQCNANGIIEVKSMNGSKLLYTFDPKNPIKKAVTSRPKAKTLEDLIAGKGFVYYGMSGELVGIIQKMLKDLTYSVEVNNKFDRATYNAVIEYQKLAKLKPDGIVGPKTYQSLVEYHKIFLRSKASGEGPKAPETKPLQPQTTGLSNQEKLAASTTPEQVKAAEQQRYFNDPGRKLFVDNINKNLNYRDPQTRRVLLWNGEPLNQQDLDNLNKYLADNGYAFTKGKDKGDAGAKYKWVFNK